MAVTREPAFRTVRVREGYDLDQVDEFVDRVLVTLRGVAGSRALTPEAVEDFEFRTVRLREGYSMDDVDDWLDAAAAELRAAARSRPARRVEPAQPVTVGAPAAVTSGVRAGTPSADHPPVPRAALPSPRTGGRPVASVAAPRTGLHHLEIWVPDLAAATRSFGWIFERLGWTLFQVWEEGRSWQAPGDGPYVVIERSPGLVDRTHDRRRAGLNHLALAVPERWMVDRIAGEAPSYGWRLLFADRHPYAGGTGHYAAYLENADGFEVEVVAA